MKPYSILNNVIFLDIETNGVDNKRDNIIKICAVKIKDNVITKFSTLVNPNRLVALSISDLLREITQKELDSAPQLKDAIKKLLFFIEDLPLVYHDEAFIEGFLKVDNEFLDLIELLAMLFPELSEFNLQYLLKKFLHNYKEENSRALSYTEDIIEMLNYAISSFYYENGYSLPMSITELEAWSWYKHLTKVNMEHVKCFIENKSIEPEKKIAESYPVFALKDYEKLFEQEEIWRRNGRNYSLRPQQRDASNLYEKD
jgi:DNA polymerase III, alpha subunit (gram-positive type)